MNMPQIDAFVEDASGNVICGSRSNVFWVEDGRLFTPRISDCGVAGLMRSKVMDTARAQGAGTEMQTVSLERLLAADEVFLTNSVIGLWPLRRLDARDYSAPGPVTAQLQAALAHPCLADV